MEARANLTEARRLWAKPKSGVAPLEGTGEFLDHHSWRERRETPQQKGTKEREGSPRISLIPRIRRGARGEWRGFRARRRRKRKTFAEGNEENEGLTTEHTNHTEEGLSGRGRRSAASSTTLALAGVPEWRRVPI